MGSNKDCEDFATACASLINAVMSNPRFSSCTGLTALVVNYFKESISNVYITSGWVEINPDTPVRGHAWCTIQKYDNSCIIAECTTPLLPHSATSTENVYGNIITITQSPLFTKGKGYGPAQLLPRNRYKAVCFLYSATAGYAVLNDNGEVGVPADAFAQGRFRQYLLQSPRQRSTILRFRVLDHNPDFENPDIIHAFKKLNLHNRSLATFNSINLNNVFPIMPSRCVRFIPANEIKSDMVFNTAQPIGFSSIFISAWCTVVAIGLFHISSIQFRHA